MSQQGNQIMA